MRAGQHRRDIEPAFIERVEQCADDFRAREIRAGLAAYRARQPIELRDLPFEHDDRYFRPGLTMRTRPSAFGTKPRGRASLRANRHLWRYYHKTEIFLLAQIKIKMCV